MRKRNGVSGLKQGLYIYIYYQGRNYKLDGCVSLIFGLVSQTVLKTCTFETIVYTVHSVYYY